MGACYPFGGGGRLGAVMKESELSVGKSPLLFSAQLKRVLFLYIVGCIIALQLTSLVEWLLVGPGPASGSWRVVAGPWTLTLGGWWLPKTLLVTLVIPGIVTLAGLRLFPPKVIGMPLAVWGINVVVMMIFWAGGYFLTGALAYQGDFMSLAIPIDHRIPFRPEWVFVYLTVYFVFILPFFYLEDRKALIAMDLSQFIALALSYTMFIYLPVAFDRPMVEVVDFATWTLDIVQGQDPPWNCFPSTHCIACTIASLALMKYNRKVGWWVLGSTIFICASTMYTKQHFVLDVVAGVALGAAIFYLVRRVVFHSWLGNRLVRLLGSDW